MAEGIDVAILFALQEEFEYFLPEVPTGTRVEQDNASGRAFLLFEYPAEMGAAYRCVTSFVGTMGAQDAGFFTKEILSRYNPRNIVLVGIAGSLNDNVCLGDVVIADEVTDYIQDGKVDEVGFAPSGRSYRPHIRLTNAVQYLSITHSAICADSNAESLADLKRTVSPEVLAKAGKALRDGAAHWHCGHLASGPVVGASSIWANLLRGLDRKFLALEMESAGVMNAVYQNAGGERVLVIRGISDMSDERKAELDGLGSFRRLAMKNALRLLKALFRADHFERAESGLSGDSLITPISESGPSGPPKASGVNRVEFDRQSEFVGGKGRVDTIAAMFNRARRRCAGPVPVTISHAGVAFADQRIDELERKTSRSEGEEREYRHLFVNKDFLESAIAKLGYAIDLALNDDRFRKDTFLNLDDPLSQFLVGLRNSSFGYGTPIFLGDSTERSWVVEWDGRPNKWNIWWRGERAMRRTIRVTDREVTWIRDKYRSDLFGNEVFEENTAFDLYALTLDTFYKIALPEVALAVASIGQTRSTIPDAMMDLLQWVFSPASPSDAYLVPQVGSPDFHRLRDSLSPR